MRYLTLGEVLGIYDAVMRQSGGVAGIRDLGALESAVAQPRMTFGGTDLYPTVSEKAAALCFSVVQNHPFLDGNKRAAHAAMETFLVLNACEIRASVDEQERVILGIASGETGREAFMDWVRAHVVESSL
jgi:death-on-curing protein